MSATYHALADSNKITDSSTEVKLCVLHKMQMLYILVLMTYLLTNTSQFAYLLTDIHCLLAWVKVENSQTVERAGSWGCQGPGGIQRQCLI